MESNATERAAHSQQITGLLQGNQSMSPWNTISDSVSVVAGLASLFVAAVFLLVTRARGSSLAWINRLFTLAAIAVGGECLVNVFAGTQANSELHIAVRNLLGISMLACAAFSIPIYNRVRRHPEYDEIHEANRQLEYTKRLFKAFLDETPFAAYVIGSDNHLLYANEKVRQDFGAGNKDIVGTSPTNWLPKEIADQILRQCSKVRSSGSSNELTLRLPRQNHIHTYLSIFFPLPGHGESLVGIVSMEISEELQSKELDSLLASIVELSPSAIYTICDKGTITSWNRGAQQMFGYSPEEIIGEPATRLAGSKHQARIAEVIDRLEAGQVLTDRPFIHLAKDGSRRLVSLSATKIKSFLGVDSSYAAIGRDETEVRRATTQMKALNRELANRFDQFSRANKELLRTRDQALEAASLKSAFVANMSHALRTPISGILGLSELILKKDLDGEISDMVQTIHTSAEALLTIINDILNLSQLEDGRLPVERLFFRPRNLVQDCLKLVMPAAVEKGLSVNLSVGPAVPSHAVGDAFKIRQILLNLLGNAIKFTAAGGIHLNVAVVTESENQVILKFSVTDSGIGIAPEDRHLLFNPFSRIEKSSRGFTGTGLGLAISKRFAELMNGSLQYESAGDHGSTFTCTVPIEKPLGEEQAFPLKQRNAAATYVHYDDSLNGCRVLAVEDNKVLSALIMRQLANIGASGELATSGEKALEKIRATKFDIILLDINLPDMSGYEVTKQIRDLEISSRQKQVIIAMTAGAMAGDRERAIEAGMNDYLAKPVNVNQLRASLSKWMSVNKKETMAREMNQTALYEGLC
jgi:PAS domain S-box-containing protein